MIIGIDGSYAINENAGIGRYVYELLRHMFNLNQEDNFEILVHFIKNAKCKMQNAKSQFKMQNVKMHYWPIPGKTKEWLMQQSAIDPIKLLVGKVDLWHAPHFISMPAKCHCPTVVTVHDVSFVHFPNFHQGQTEFYNKMCKLAAAKADMVIADSKSTAKDFSQYFNCPKEKIKVIYLGHDRDMYRPLLKIKRENFIFSAGTVEPRKNYAGLLKAYAKLSNDLRKKYPLKIAGDKGWDYQEIFDTVKKLRLKDQVEFLGRVSEQRLSELYNACSLFIYPSLYEGFGLPVLEAMACGAPVVTSNISSLPEVGGEVAEYINPHDTNDIAKIMAKLLQNEKYRLELGKKGIKQASKFSWEKCAKETMNVYSLKRKAQSEK